MDPITASFIIGGAILLFMKGKKKNGPPAPPVCAEGQYWDAELQACVAIPVDDPTPDPTKPPSTSKIIGTGSTWDWPEKSKYPTQMHIAQAIIGLGGYSLGNEWAMGDNVFNFATDPNAKAGVKEFQRDWNQVGTDLAWGTLVNGIPGNTSGRPVKSLSADGYIGPNTWKAMLWAFNFRATKGEGAWQARVSAAKALN